MPIPLDDLITDFLLVGEHTTVSEALARLPERRTERFYTYVIVPVADGRFIVARWHQVEEIAVQAGANLLNQPLATLPGMPAPSVAVEQSSNKQQAEWLRDAQPGRRLVVLSNGAVIGLLMDEMMNAGAIAPDPFPATLGAAPEESGASKGIEPTAPPHQELAAPPPEDNRVINGWLEDHSHDQPLELGASYELRFQVAVPRRDSILPAIGVADVIAQASPDLEKIPVLVVLVTTDFDIEGDTQQTLSVPRAIKPSNKVTFTITPKKNGASMITALFFANGRMFQQATITLQVGALAPATQAIAGASSGLTVGSGLAQAMRAHAVDLVILKKEAGYQFVFKNGGFTTAMLNLSEQQIADQIAYARDELKKIVYKLKNNQYVYQNADTSIPADVHQESLQLLAGLGFDLYENLFYAPGNGADARAMGDLLRKRSQAGKLHIQIVAERFIFPWALLYDRDTFDPASVNADSFWGFKHVVEYTPQFTSATPLHFTPEMSVGDTLELGFVCNTTIDEELQKKGFKFKVIEPQREFLNDLPGVKVAEYPNIADLYALLNAADGPTQLIYFFCHAESELPGAGGGVDASKFLLSDGEVLLRDLKRNARMSGPALKNAPLVFINACQSAKLSPYLYDGLVPYLIAKGVRGVIGTEVDTPTMFAAEFAQQFLKRFTAGEETLGELLLKMRREYLEQKNNVMGLVYALYCSGDVVVRRVAAD
jgi:hypothetical protein